MMDSDSLHLFNLFDLLINLLSAYSMLVTLVVLKNSDQHSETILGRRVKGSEK